MASSHPNVLGEANQVADTFFEAFSLFGQCHRGYNSSHHMSDEEIDKLGNIMYVSTIPVHIHTSLFILRNQHHQFFEVLQEKFPSCYSDPQDAHS